MCSLLPWRKSPPTLSTFILILNTWALLETNQHMGLLGPGTVWTPGPPPHHTYHLVLRTPGIAAVIAPLLRHKRGLDCSWSTPEWVLVTNLSSLHLHSHNNPDTHPTLSNLCQSSQNSDRPSCISKQGQKMLKLLGYIYFDFNTNNIILKERNHSSGITSQDAWPIMIIKFLQLPHPLHQQQVCKWGCQCIEWLPI